MRKTKAMIACALTLLMTTLSACDSVPAAYDPHSKLGPQINYTITGIDAGAGIMNSTTKALKAYELPSEKWQPQTSSTAAMTSMLGKAIKHRQPIVVTGWQPHWMFTRFPIKFLKDPRNVYGKAETIHTIVRKGLQKDDPTAYNMLDRFHWTSADMSEVMLAVNDGTDPREAAESWVTSHPSQMREWISGLAKVTDSPKLLMTYVA